MDVQNGQAVLRRNRNFCRVEVITGKRKYPPDIERVFGDMDEALGEARRLLKDALRQFGASRNDIKSIVWDWEKFRHGWVKMLRQISCSGECEEMYYNARWHIEGSLAGAILKEPERYAMGCLLTRYKETTCFEKLDGARRFRKQSIGEACREIGISRSTWNSWRKRGMQRIRNLNLIVVVRYLRTGSR